MAFPEEFQDLANSARAFLYLATTMPDGSPQVTPVWFDVEGDLIRINTSVGRVKDLNMRARPAVAMVIQDLSDPYRYLGVRGEVISYTTEGADEHIDLLSMKYDGVHWTPHPGQTRVIYRIRPVHFDRH